MADFGGAAFSEDSVIKMPFSLSLSLSLSLTLSLSIHLSSELEVEGLQKTDEDNHEHENKDAQIAHGGADGGCQLLRRRRHLLEISDEA